MARSDSRRTSKLLSLILRHSPEAFAVELDAEGFTDVTALLSALSDKGEPLSRQALEDLVRESDKQRFAFSADGSRIRAQQGHSVPVELGHPETPPPPQLYHGTVARFLAAIRREGLTAGARHHVHLSSSTELAERVGERRGRPVVLSIDSGSMAAAGEVFYLTPNGVWLTRHVSPAFISFPP